MDYEQTYEILLKTQCEAYKKMLQLFDQIEGLDGVLSKLSVQNKPDVNKIHAITLQKERLIQKLDEISLYTEQTQEKLENISGLCQKANVLPLYHRMEELKHRAYHRIGTVIHKEDSNNPGIIKRLTAYKESLELDLKIKDIPLSKRRIFMYMPDRRK